jgi:hypothetical protein
MKYNKTESCGAVTQKITHPDGSTGGKHIRLPGWCASICRGMNIAGGMPNRISMNVTVPKQTQGTIWRKWVKDYTPPAQPYLRFGRKLFPVDWRLVQGLQSTYIVSTIQPGGGATMNSQTSSTPHHSKYFIRNISKKWCCNRCRAAVWSSYHKCYTRLNRFRKKFCRECFKWNPSGKRERRGWISTGRRQYSQYFGGQQCMQSFNNSNIRPE